MNILIARDRLDASCRMGVLTGADLSLQTLELPWIPDPAGGLGGLPDKSCIPAGTYALVLHNTAHHPHTFALVNAALGVLHEPNPAFPRARTACLLHSANIVAELEGCIGLGLQRSGDEILESATALAQFKAAVPWVPGHTLTITE